MVFVPQEIIKKRVLTLYPTTRVCCLKWRKNTTLRYAQNKSTFSTYYANCTFF